MDPQTRFANKANESQQHLRSYELLRRESVSELVAAMEADREARRHTGMAQAFRASFHNDWSMAPTIRDRTEKIAAEWRIQPRLSNSILLDEPLSTRGLTVASGSGGGYLVGTAKQLAVQEAHDTVGTFFDLVTVNTAVENTGGVFVGKFQTLPTVTVLSSESATISEQTPVAGQALLGPKNLASWGRASRQWVLQSEAGAAANSRLHVNAVKTKGMQQILEGSGASGQLQGLIGNSDVPTAAGTSVDLAKICTAMESVEKTGSGPFAWIVSAGAAKLLRQRAQISGGAAILADGMIGGYPCYVTGCTTNAIAVFGSWKDLLVYQWRPLEVSVDPYSDFQSGMVGVRAWLTIDALPMLATSFYTLTAIT